MTEAEAIKVLKQDGVRNEFLSESRPWTIVYKSWYSQSDENGGIFSALAPSTYRKKALSNLSWDLSIGDGVPLFTQTNFSDEKPTANYLRYGNLEDIEPLVIRQTFHGVKETQIKLCDEFVLLFNLWHDKQTNRLIKIEDDGNETEVAIINENEVRIRTSHLKQFIAAKQYDLLIFIDSVKYIDYEGELDFNRLSKKFTGKTYSLERYANVGMLRQEKFSRLFGKKVVPPPPVESSGIWPFEDEVQEYPEFIISEDESGKPVYATCNPDVLQNNFGGKKGAPHYLSPVFFRRDVLQKYYERPELYSVEDGYLRCQGLWGLRLDNDNPEHVVVYLGDLGRDLPSSERHHWKSFNVEAVGHISETNFQRSFMGEFADAQAPDLVFRKNYPKLIQKWEEAKGWPLYKKTHSDDRHLINKVRIPLNESASEFEGQISSLTKLLVDRLNEEHLARELGGSLDDEKGIQKLERYLKSIRYPFIDRDIKLLKELQSIRSQGVAHSKGSKYEEFRNSITGGKTRFMYIGTLLVRANAMIDGLTEILVEI